MAFKSSEIQIYRYINGRQVILEALWHAIECEGKLPLFWPSASAPDGYDVNKFVDITEAGRYILYIVFYRGVLAGCFQIEAVHNVMALGHFMPLMGAGKNILRIGVHVLAWAMDQHGLDILLGFVPATNKLALKLLARLGGVVIAVVPRAMFIHSMGRNVDAVLIAFYREKVHENLRLHQD